MLKISNSLTLMLAALLLAIALSIPLGIFAALKPGGIADAVSNVLTFTGVSIPGFIIAIFLIYVFSARLEWLPSWCRFPQSFLLGAADSAFVLRFHRIIGPVVKQVRGPCST
jgi:peptide/nickel transport system permease protein